MAALFGLEGRRGCLSNQGLKDSSQEVRWAASLCQNQSHTGDHTFYYVHNAGKYITNFVGALLHITMTQRFKGVEVRLSYIRKQ